MIVRLRQIARAARRAIARAVTGPRGGAPPARPAGVSVSSGWIGPHGRVEAAAGTAVHLALLTRFEEPTMDGVFAKGAVRSVDGPHQSVVDEVLQRFRRGNGPGGSATAEPDRGK